MKKRNKSQTEGGEVRKTPPGSPGSSDEAAVAAAENAADVAGVAGAGATAGEENAAAAGGAADVGAAAAADSAAESGAGEVDAAGAAGEMDWPAMLEAAQKAAAESQDNYLRTMAELENVRRRSEKKIGEAYQYALKEFVPALGEVRDCLEAALGSASEQAEKMQEGVSLTLRKLTSAMDAHHISPIKPDIGAAFDPALHMAIGQAQANAQAAADTVAAVVQNGYMLHGRVIRAASVLVATAAESAGEATAAAASATAAAQKTTGAADAKEAKDAKKTAPRDTAAADKQ